MRKPCGFIFWNQKHFHLLIVDSANQVFYTLRTEKNTLLFILKIKARLKYICPYF
jgi:hypothetical protein